MHEAKTEFLGVDDGSLPLCISCNLYGFERHCVVHSLDRDVAGHAWLDDSGGALWGSGYLGGWLVGAVRVWLDNGVPGWRGH